MEAAYKGAILTAIITSLACIGDTILYSVLPVYANALGLSDFWLGFLLSINRFIRIISHGVIASTIIRFGLKKVVTLSALGATLSTLAYKMPSYLFLFVGSRIIWGISYSGFRQAILYYSANVATKRNETFAISNVLKSIGPLLILLGGPFIFKNLGYEKSFLFIASISAVSLFLAFFLPKIKLQAENYHYRNVLIVSWFKLILFFISFVVDGFIIVILSILFSKNSLSSSSLFIMVSFYLLLKRLISFLLPLVFLKSYSLFSIKLHFNSGVLLIILGQIFLFQGIYEIGLVVLFLGSTITQNVAPIAGLQKNELQKMEVITSVTFWWDIGKTLGSFTGILMYKNFGGDNLFLIFSLVLIFALILLSNQANESQPITSGPM